MSIGQACSRTSWISCVLPTSMSKRWTTSFSRGPTRLSHTSIWMGHRPTQCWNGLRAATATYSLFSLSRYSSGCPQPQCVLTFRIGEKCRHDWPIVMRNLLSDAPGRAARFVFAHNLYNALAGLMEPQVLRVGGYAER